MEGLSSVVSETRRGPVLWVYVSPGSSESYLEFVDGELVFHSSARCKGHGVNYDLIRWFSRAVGVRPVIARGWSSRRKMLLFPGADRDSLVERLEKAVATRSPHSGRGGRGNRAI
jgi:uncharacterized protein YggU (UPF0235/DUF167 family)